MEISVWIFNLFLVEDLVFLTTYSFLAIMDPDMVARLRSMYRDQLAAMAGVSPQMVDQLLAQMSLDGGGMSRASSAGNFYSSNEPGKAPPVFDSLSPNLPRPGSFPTPAEIRRK